MKDNSIELIIASDIHYVKQAVHNCPIEERRTELGLKLLSQVISYASKIKADALIFLGDLVDNGQAEKATSDLKEMRELIRNYNIPYYLVSGNHDGDSIWQVFNVADGLTKLKQYNLFFFNDTYYIGDKAERRPADIRQLKLISQESKNPTIVFQHNPIYPEINSDYPYNLVNSNLVMEAYEKSDVILSISGHYHSGIDLLTKNGVNYITCPALCEEPFSFLHLKVAEREVKTHMIDIGSL